MDLWQILEIAGTIIGLVYLWLEYKANVWLWLAGIIMPAIYIYVYYKSGFYADMGINVWYLFAGLYGWAVWLGKGFRNGKRGSSESPNYGDNNHPESNRVMRGNPPPIMRTPMKAWLPLSLVAAAFFVAISYILVNFTDSTVPYGDSFTTALSIVAMWMLARKYAEQWLVWIVVDIVCFGLYLYKGLYPTAVLYGLYSVIAVFGYLKWIRMMNKQNERTD